MSNDRKTILAIQQAVAEEGLEIVSLTQNRHLKVRVRLNGKEAVWVVAVSAGDRRTWLNQRSELRRIARRLACTSPALGLVMPEICTDFVGLQTNNVPEQSPDMLDFLLS